jgi:hypothetical protein
MVREEIEVTFFLLALECSVKVETSSSSSLVLGIEVV